LFINSKTCTTLVVHASSYPVLGGYLNFQTIVDFDLGKNLNSESENRCWFWVRQEKNRNQKNCWPRFISKVLKNLQFSWKSRQWTNGQFSSWFSEFFSNSFENHGHILKKKNDNLRVYSGSWHTRSWLGQSSPKASGQDTFSQINYYTSFFSFSFSPYPFSQWGPFNGSLLYGQSPAAKKCRDPTVEACLFLDGTDWPPSSWI